MAKQLNVSLGFTADTSQAKAQIQDLQNSLSQIANMPSTGNSLSGMKKELKEASSAALNLQVHLKNAINQDTGRIDFAKLNQSIKKSGQSLNSYADKLRSIGPQGEQAFLKLARAVATSEIPIRRSNQALNEMWTTMKNTARWQLSSSVLHGFMGTIQSAYGYAQDLNESLNNIRIVTGYSTDQMAKFAAEANKAAKSLSTTTTEYTNASLIYYQQGLNDQQVKERTDITVKMANVSRESAQVVSDQMTAVWNNFDDGSKSLEYYADVMTALGAATASSTAEISAGLEKFAAIAETVGLSYEYATASLATITATTRQSADVVGNALKTLFARIQGLKLGETLEDGVDLNKYSAALKSVGVEVLTANGQMREMDDILNDLAAKWDTIGKAEQTALAQTVAGVRQYTQLVALMDNWDFMEQNLETAYGSSGALEEQAKIYEESWEAASKRVKASMQNIFDSLLNDKFFITVLNGFENILTVVGSLIDSLGGMGGAISAIGLIFTKVFSSQMQTGFENLAYNITAFSMGGQQQIKNERADFLNSIAGEYDQQSRAQSLISGELGLQQKRIAKDAILSSYEKDFLAAKMDQVVAMDDMAIEAAQKEERAKRNKELSKDKLRQAFSGDENATVESVTAEVNKVEKEIDRYNKAQAKLNEIRGKIDEDNQLSDEDRNTLLGLMGIDKYEGSDRELLEDAITDNDRQRGAFLRSLSEDGREAAENYIKSSQNVVSATEEMTSATERAKDVQKEYDDAVEEAGGGLQGWGATLSTAVGAASSAIMAFNILGSIMDTISNPDLTGWERFTAILGSVVMLIPAIVNAWSGFATVATAVKTAISTGTMATTLNTIAKMINAAATREQAEAAGESADQTQESAKALNEETKELLKNSAIKKITKRDGEWTAQDEDGNDVEIPEEIRNLLSGEDEDSDVVGQIRSVLTGNAFQGLLGSLRGLIGLIGPWVAGIAAIAGAIWVASEAWVAHEKAAQKAALAAQEASDRYSEVQGSFESFKTQVDGFESAVDSISNLTKGTEEYADAIGEANKKTRELIEAHGLYGQFTYDDGLIKFNEGVLESLEKQKELATYNAENLKYYKQYESSEANLNRDRVNLRRDIGFFQADVDSATEGSLKYMSDEILNTTAEAITAWKEAGTELDLSEWISQHEIYSKSLGQYTDMIEANQGPLTEFADKTSAAAEAAAYFARAILENNISKEYGDQLDKMAGGDSQKRDLLSGAAATLAYNTDEQTLSSVWGESSGIAWMDSLNEWSRQGSITNAIIGASNDEELARMYAQEILGYTAEETANWTYEGGVGKGGFTDAAGKAVGFAEQLSDAQMRIALYERQFLENYSADSAATMVNEVLPQYLKGAEESSVDISNSVLSALAAGSKDIDFSTADYGAINEDEFNQMKSLYDQGSFDQIAQMFGVLPEMLDSLGGAEKFATELMGNYENGQWSKEKFREGANAQGNAKAESYELDLDQFKAYRDILYETNDKLREQPELLNAVAIAQLRLNKGAKSVKDSYADLAPLMKKALKELNSKDGKISVETWSEISSYIEETTDALGDMLNLDSNALKNIDPEFLVENYDLLTQAANGSQSALDKLQANTIKKLGKEIGIASEEFYNLADAMASSGEGIEPGDIIPNVDLAAEVSAMYMDAVQAAIDGGMSVADAMAYAQSMINAAQIEIPETEMEAREITVTGDIPDGWEPVLGEPAVTTDASGKQIAVQGTKITAIEGGQYTYTYTILAPKKGANIAKTSEKVGGGGGSGGGGGGGGSKRDDKKVDAGERYHTLTRQLEDIKDEYDEISKAADRAFGKDKLNLIDKQTAKLDEQIAKQEELIAAVEEYANGSEKVQSDKSAMEDLFYGWTDDDTGDYHSFWEYLPEDANIPMHIEYDGRGNITNYADIEQAMVDAYNAAKDSDMSDEEFEKFGEKYDEFFEKLDQYEETYDKLKEEEAALQDLINQRIDLQLEKVKYEVELKIDVSEDSLELLDFYLNRLSDDAFAVADTLVLLGAKFDEVQDQFDAYEKGLEDVIAQSGLTYEEMGQILSGELDINNYDFTEEQVNTIREYKSAMMESVEAMEAIREEAQNKLSEAFDAWNEKLQDNLSVFEHLNNTLQSYKNIIDIVGKKTLGVNKGLMDSLNDTFIKNGINQIEGSRKAWEALQSTEESAKKALEQAKASGVKEDIEYWEKEVARINEEEEAAQETLLSNWENTLSAIVEQFENAVEEAVDTFNRSFTGDGTLLSDAFAIREKENERYIKDYEKIYELSKLTRDVNNSIDNSSNLAEKSKLKELLKEINKYEEEGLQMTEYDVEYLQKKYDLYKAQIALEEAQAAKDTVRLQRDSEGGLSYVYTSSNDKITEAQQKYEDALFAMQELNYEYQEELESSIVSTVEEASEALANIKREDFATTEEYMAEINRVSAFYDEQILYYQNQMQSSIDKNKELYEQDWAAYNRITGYKISANENFITSWKDTTLGQLTNSESETVDIYERVVASLDVLIGGLLDAYGTMSQDIDDANKAAGSSTAGFSETAAAEIGKVADESEAAGGAVEEMASQMEDGFESATTALTAWQSRYSDAMKTAVENTMGVVGAYNLLIETLRENKIPEPEVDYGPGSSSSGTYKGGKGNTKAGDGEKDTRLGSTTDSDYFDRQEYDYQQITSYHATAKDNNSFKKKKQYGFDTGGYTGEWGEEGRLAWLHQKEIVLNKEDTSNLLNAVDLVRQLTHTIDLNAQAASLGVGFMQALTLREDKSQTLQQEVTIHAEFPNVQNRSEIEEAFNNLINVSAQYARRK